MAEIIIPDENGWARFNVTTAQSVFVITYAYLAKSDLTVYVDDVALGDGDWSHTPDETDEGGYTGGTITLNTAVSNATVEIVRDITASRTDNLASGPIAATQFNAEFRKIQIQIRDLQRDADRALKASLGEFQFSLGDATDRTSKALAFDANGAVDLISRTNIDALASRTAAIDALSTAARLAAIDAIKADFDGSDTIGDAAALLAVTAPGLVAKQTDGTPVSRTLEAQHGLGWDNANAGAGNPSVKIDTPSTVLTRLGAGSKGVELLEAANANTALEALDANLAAFLSTYDLPTVQGVVGQALGFPNSATTVEPYTPAGAGDVLASANETITGRYGFDGGFDVQTKYEVVKAQGTGVDSLAAIHAARDRVGVGGVIALTGGQDYEISANIQMNVQGQTLYIPEGASISTQDATQGNAIQVLADDCSVLGGGTLNTVSVIAGNATTQNLADGVKVIGLTFKDPLNRSIQVQDCFSIKPVIIEGNHIYWSSASAVANAMAFASLMLPLNVETAQTGVTGQNVFIRDNLIDFSVWTLENFAELGYPASSGSPGAVGIRLRANIDSVFSDWVISGNTVRLPAASSFADWNPTSYGNAADGVGERRPGGYEVTAIRQTLTYTSKVGTFTANETLTGGTSGTTCSFGSDASGTMQVYGRQGSFTPGETITGGTSGATATYQSIQGNLRRGIFANNSVYGGDLGFSFGGADNTLFSGNRADGDPTSYCLEYANGRIIYGAGNFLKSATALKALSATDTPYVSLSGTYVECGFNSNDINTGVSTERVLQLNLTGSTLRAGADNVEMINLRGATATEANLTGVTFIGTGQTGVQAVRASNGSPGAITLVGAHFQDIDTAAIVIDSGITVGHLTTIGCIGNNSAGYTNNGTVTTHINHSNFGISGLNGGAALSEIAAATPADGNIIVGNGTSWVAESGDTARTSLGLGTGDAPTFEDLKLQGSTPTLTMQPAADTQIAVITALNTAGGFRGNYRYDYPTNEWRWTSAGSGASFKMTLSSGGQLDTLLGYSAAGTQVVGTRVVDADLAAAAAMTAQALTDNSGGAVSDTIAAIGGTYSQSEVSNAIASLADEVNKLRADLVARDTLLEAVRGVIDSHGLGKTS